MKITILTSIILGIAITGNAQTEVTNAGNLRVHPGGLLTINGAFTNAATAAFENNGAVHLKGDVTNQQAAMATGSGTLHISGGSVQTISGTEAIKTFHLVTNNASGITLNNELRIGGTHSFAAGLITTLTATDYVVYEAGAVYTGSSDASHINGNVKKLGATDFVFPVGNATYERTIALQNLSATSEFAVSYKSNAPNPHNMMPPLVLINRNEYWEVTKLSGGTARVAMNWNHAKVNMFNWSIPDIRVVAQSGINYWADTGGDASGTTTTTGTITSVDTAVFSRFAFGGTSYSLAATAVRFTARKMGGATEVNWTTATESGIQVFDVERSDNGAVFYHIATARPRNTANNEHYSAMDNKPLKNNVWYRLKTTAASGTYRYSDVVKLTANSEAAAVKLLANPVTERLTIVGSGNLTGSFTYHLFSAAAQVVQQGKISFASGVAEIILSQSIKPGMYSLVLNGGQQKFTLKVVVQ